jgi:hypothetical protein
MPIIVWIQIILVGAATLSRQGFALVAARWSRPVEGNGPYQGRKDRDKIILLPKRFFPSFYFCKLFGSGSGAPIIQQAACP